MSDNYYRLSEISAKRQQQAVDFFLGNGIEISCRLIGQQYCGTID